MYFGKFLLDQKIISKSQLIEGMAFQLESQPSLLRVLQESSLLEEDKVIDLIDVTLKTNRTLVESLLEEKSLASSEVRQLLEKRSIKGVGLAQAMVSLGFIKTSEADRVLKEYAKVVPEKTSPEGPAEVVPSAAAMESLKELGISDEAFSKEDLKENDAKATELIEVEDVKNEKKTIVSSAALESLRDLGITDESLIIEDNSLVYFKNESGDESQNLNASMKFYGPSSEYTNVFSSFLHDDLTNRIKKLVKGFDEDNLMSIHKDLNLLLGAASLADLKFSEKVLNSYVKFFEDVLERKINFTAINFLGFGSVFKKSLQSLWDLRNEISESGSEKIIFNNAKWKLTYMENLKHSLLIFKKGSSG